jgi:hypothetical protein
LPPGGGGHDERLWSGTGMLHKPAEKSVNRIDVVSKSVIYRRQDS